MTTTRTMQTREDLGSAALTSRYDDALQFAAAHHRDQCRKGSRVPYLSHLMSVSALVLEHGGSEDQAIAALLHDAVEDAPRGRGPEILDGIGTQFGGSVREMVAACSDSLNESETGKESWRERKVRYVAGLADPDRKSDDAVLVTAADKTHNALSIARDLRDYGTGFWKTFNACEHDLLWYYTAVEGAITARLGDHTVVTALHRAVDELIEASGTTRRDVPHEPSEDGCPHDS